MVSALMSSKYALLDKKPYLPLNGWEDTVSVIY